MKLFIIIVISKCVIFVKFVSRYWKIWRKETIVPGLSTFVNFKFDIIFVLTVIASRKQRGWELIYFKIISQQQSEYTVNNCY